MFIPVIRFLRGSVRFSVRDGFVERFINLCAHGGVPIWGGRKRDGVYTACTTMKGARQLERLAQKAGVTLEMGGASGVPFLLRSYRKRVGLLAGSVILLAALLFMGSFIWRIDVVGAETVNEKDILTVLDDLGVRRGVLRSSIDAVDVARQMVLRLPDLSWAAVNLQGSVATVEVRERVAPPARVDDDVPHNVLAKETGFITYMEVYEGQPTVQVGDSVAAGDILVSGIMEDKNGFSRTVHARAKIVAQTRETLSLRIPYQREAVSYRGLEVRRWLNIFSLRIPLGLGGAPQEPYKLESATLDIPFISAVAPITLTRENYILIRRDSYAISQDEARLLAELQMPEMEAAAFEGSRVLERQWTGQALDECFLLEGVYLVEGEIGEEREILLDNPPEIQ